MAGGIGSHPRLRYTETAYHMIDIHHHLLFGLDDGPNTLEESVAMAAMAAQDGITHVVCTPHASHRYTFRPEEISERLASVQEAISQAGIPLILGRGCDFHMTWDNVQDAKNNPAKYSINGKRYLLIELADHFIPMGLQNAMNALQYAGLVPILTHPERNPALQRNPDQMKNWIADGVLVQVTAGAVLGRFGSTAQKLAHRFLQDRWVHFLATDAHNLSGRPPKMREAFQKVAHEFGIETAERLCIRNPLAVFNGEELGRQPVARHIDEYDDIPAKSSWISRLLRR